MLDDPKENATLISVSPEQLYEQAEDKEDRTCEASTCIFARWLKPASVRELKFVSKDVLLIRVGKTLMFYNVRTQREDLLTVGGSRSTPSGGGDCLPLDGVGCVDCCGIDLLALAEQPPIAKVIVCRYPDFKVLATLADNSSTAAYKSISFLRTEYLIGLRDYPAFDLIVWAWRVQEKLFAVNTGFIQPDQSLNLSAIGRDVYLSHTERDVRCKLQLWTVFIGCKTVYAERSPVDLSDHVYMESGCWTLGGWFVFCDASANVYRAQPGSAVPEMCVEYTGSSSGRDGGSCRTLLCPSKQGFVLYADAELVSFKEAKSVYTKIWTIAVGCTLLSIVQAGENDFYGWSVEGTLLELTQKKEQILKVYGTNIKYFAFVKPADETVVTVNEKNILQAWDVSTGEFKSEMKLNGVVTNVCSNPLYSYIAVSFKNGKVELLIADPKANGLEHVAKIVLCDEELSSVRFFFDAKECVATSFPSGRFYHISIELGQTCSVVREHRMGDRLQVIGVEVFDDKRSSFLAVLHTASRETTEVPAVGNSIVIFDKHFNTVFTWNDTRRCYYSTVFKWISSDVPDTINMALTVAMSRRVHVITVDVVQGKALKSETVPLDHHLRSVEAFAEDNRCVTFSRDGTYNLYEIDGGGRWRKIVTVNCSHWQTGGLVAARVDCNGRNVLTLSRRGNFMCTSFRESCDHRGQAARRIDTPTVTAGNTKTEGIGSDVGPDSLGRMTWTTINQKNKLNASKIIYSKQKNQIIEDFETIKNELLTLLERNINGPEDTKINIEEFDLNVDYRLWFREKCKIDRQRYEEKVLGDINRFKTETANILKEHWESLFVKPRSIHCLKQLYKVDNYPISMIDQEVISKANAIIEKRLIIKGEEKPSASVDVQPSNELSDDQTTTVSESNYKQSNDESLMGSISHRFVDTVKSLNSQYNYYKLDMAEDEIVLLKFMINKLKHEFNKRFDDMFIEKQRQLDNLKGYNDRLRAIETEFALACKIAPAEPSPVDYEWDQYEQTDKLVHVEDDEVPVKPYRSVGGKVLTDADSCGDGRDGGPPEPRPDEFRQRALLDMMDGVLEKRWEDELKNDVPRPRCTVDKKPEDYTREEYRAVDEYEKAAAAWNAERLKYKKILEDEKATINRRVDESVNEFDSNVFKLFQIKLKYDSAIDQECLKIIRLSKMLSDSDQRNRRIKLHEETNLEIEKSLGQLTRKIAKTENTLSSLLNTIETSKHKNNVLNKRFKSEFPSKLIYEQALIAYNRRPKLQGNKSYSPLLGYQFVNTIMDPTDDKLDLLCSEFVKYLDTLRVYDDYKYVDDYKLNMDRETWHKVCNFRRLKIESEFKISTYQRDAADKTNLLENLIRVKDDKEATIEKHKISVTQLESEDFRYEDDPEIQLVVNQGNTEINLTGHFGDFENTTLIAQNAIDEVNAEIKEMGKIKINVLSNLLMFKRKCRLLKWEHEILSKHKIILYKYRFDVITSMKVTENILHYLKFKAKGINIAKQAEQKVDKELAGIQITYSKEKQQLEHRLNELVEKIRVISKENKKTDKNIDQMNLHLSTLKNKIDHSLTNKLKLFSDLRTKNIMKRAQMMTNIQELHKEVHVLQTQLELLLLKTFPTLYNIPKNTSIRK